MTAAWRGAWMAALVWGASACGGDSDGPGSVAVTLTGAVGARAAEFKVVGMIGTIAAANGTHVYSNPLAGDTVHVIVVAAAGHTLQEAAMATVTVPAVNAATRYGVQVVQVAGATYALQNPATYTVSIVEQP